MISIDIIAFSFSTELYDITLLYSFVRYFFDYIYIPPLNVCGVSLTGIKEFKVFWTGPFISSSVKFTDTFWSVSGIIDGFNESLRQITSEV